MSFDYTVDPLLTANIQNAVRRCAADVLEETEEGIFIYDRESRIYLLYAPAEQGKVWLQRHEELNYERVILYDDEIVAFAAARYCLQIDEKCHQVVWTKPYPPEIDKKLRVRTADAADGPVCFEMYHDSPDVRRAIAGGKILLGYEGEDLVGMIGIHDDGSMGMLEILPPFRRKGYGTELEKRQIAIVLSEGSIPFAQVYLSNTASLTLQKSIGMEVSEGTLTWMWRE